MSLEVISEHVGENLKFNDLGESRHCKNLNFCNFGESKLKMVNQGLIKPSSNDLWVSNKVYKKLFILYMTIIWI